MKSDETTPTPRPWKVEQRDGVISAITPNGSWICVKEHDCEQADADLIVRCVNSHDALVEALQKIARGKADCNCCVGDCSCAGRHEETARAALQKAGGK